MPAKSYFLLPALIVAGCTPGVLVRLAPPPAEIVLDGQVQAGEWGIPDTIPAEGDVHLRMDEDFLYVAVRGNAIRPVHLYLGQPGEVHVLHASGALGRAVYELAEDDWTLTETFTWEVRDPHLGRAAEAPEVEDERAAYLMRNGWAANTIGMGEAGQVEFKLARDYVAKQGRRLAVSYLWAATDSTEALRHWPAEAHITPDEMPLLMGNDVPATFTLEGWHATAE